MNTFSPAPEDSTSHDRTKRKVSLTIFIIVIAFVLVAPLPLILLGNSQDALGVIYLFPTVFFMVLIRATAQQSQGIKILWRVIGLALAVGFIFLFANVVPNSVMTVSLAVVGLILCFVFEFLAPSSVTKKQVS